MPRKLPNTNRYKLVRRATRAELCLARHVRYASMARLRTREASTHTHSNSRALALRQARGWAFYARSYLNEYNNIKAGRLPSTGVL